MEAVPKKENIYDVVFAYDIGWVADRKNYYALMYILDAHHQGFLSTEHEDIPAKMLEWDMVTERNGFVSWTSWTRQYDFVMKILGYDDHSGKFSR